MEFNRRDLRWCHGNMQYWQLLTLPGLKPVSRFHLAFGIWMYLGSPAWIAMTAVGTVLLALSDTPATQYVPMKGGPGVALFAIVMLMTFAPKIATVIDVLLEDVARRSFGGLIPLVLNIAVETFFTLLLAPIVALSHTLFLVRLFLLRRGTSWHSQARESHAVPWRLAFAKLWPQTLAGCTILGVVALKSPTDLGFVLLGTSGLILSAPFAVATASPVIGSLFARIGIGRIPEENEHPEALRPLFLPAIEITSYQLRRNPERNV
jgi:membrane glycosyltransferase